MATKIQITVRKGEWT